MCVSPTPSVAPHWCLFMLHSSEKAADTRRVRPQDEMARTQKNKATNGHMGRLKAKAAKLRSELVEGEKTSKGTGPAEGFDVRVRDSADRSPVQCPAVLARLTHDAASFCVASGSTRPLGTRAWR